MAGESSRGKFVWYDLMTSDRQAAQPFYQSLTGWGTAPFEGGDMPYTMWTLNEAPLGGLMDIPEQAAAAGAPPNWMPYVGTDDLDATVAKLTQLGGQVFKPAAQIPDAGRFAVVGDPQGAVFALYQPGANDPPPGPSGPAEPGQFSWHELLTTDHEAAFEFYSALFGWEKTSAMDMGEMGTYQMYGRQGQELGGMYNKPAEMPAPPHWLLYIKVDDMAATLEKVTAGGGQILRGPMDVPGGDQVAECLDPQGAAFAVHQAAGG